MLLIPQTETDPFFNLAAEEYLLREKDEDICMLWRNEPTIVLGKHQNALAEINVEFTKRAGIHVVRRLSGGGTVYHDEGNINFTFIRNAPQADGINIDFKVFTNPVVQALAGLGVEAVHSGRNDLLVNGMKISGNAEHVFQQKKRTLHHGTLLFSSRLGDLSEALKVNPLKFEDKAVRSVRSKVTNIRDHLKQDMDADAFYHYLVSFMSDHFSDVHIYQFTDDEKKTISALVDTRYKTWEWNFGYSPRYRFRKTVRTGSDELLVDMSVEKGIIREIKFEHHQTDEQILRLMESELTGCRHYPDDLRTCLENIGSDAAVNGLTPAEFAAALV